MRSYFGVEVEPLEEVDNSADMMIAVDIGVLLLLLLLGRPH